MQPDSSKQFIVEVDASDAWVGAVLSQFVGPENRLHPCAFFSRRLSPTESNYDVGNRALLAINWRWRSGDIGWKELKSLLWFGLTTRTYLQTAKRLNSRQAR